MQVLCVAMSIQVSGLAHFAADAFDRATCAADDCDHRRAGDDGDGECPPGCPTCHTCAHAQAPYTPHATSLLDAPVLFVADREPVDTMSPPSRRLPGVFRPPRIICFVHA